jgi:peptidoglycan/xylan/chitin deacetylase (PgdA/CDA1 family)
MAKNWIKRGLIASGATRAAGVFAGKKAVILMYHSVMDDPTRQALTLGEIIHSTTVFQGQMELLARKYHPVSLDDVLLFVRGEKGLPARPVVVTFDDGYADNHDVAMPILNQTGVPATFYATVDCIETGTLPWPSRLRHAFLTTHQSRWEEPGGATWPLRQDAYRQRAFLRASDIAAKLTGQLQNQFVQAIETKLDVGPPAPTEKLMMTWEQVRSLVTKGHVVGSHTLTHPNMAQINDDEAAMEMSQSKQRLEQVLHSPVVHFSYPCPALTPHWKESTVAMSRKLGYLTAVTTDAGQIRRNDDPHSLHRTRPTKDVEGLHWNLECSFLGLAR